MGSSRSVAVLAVALTASLAPSPASGTTQPAPYPTSGGQNLEVYLGTVPQYAHVGQVVEVVATVSDPDRFTVVDRRSVDYGDGSMSEVGPGRRVPCQEPVESAWGLHRDLRSYHVFREPGVYTLVVRVEATQRLCGRALAPTETVQARLRFVVLS